MGSVYTLLSPEQKIRRRELADPIVDFVDGVLYRAIESRSSDIHFQPDGQQMRIRFRIDGVLYDQEVVQDASLVQQMLSRLKVLSSIDIAEKRLPQDGKFTIEVERGQETIQIDARVATFPSIYGEKIVVRILDRSHNVLSLEALGLSANSQQVIHALLSNPHGFFLVTGPTGSGKTTTLYAMLAQLNHREKNIVTMEDPVEYNLIGITQSQVNLKAGFSFENGLRSLLRQDPDIIMIGEIRDLATLRIAIESALTGHLVFSTLHTNDAVGAIVRLYDMGVEPFLISSCLSGVLAQRLARRLCMQCRYEAPLAEHERAFVVRHGIDLATTFQSRGCQHCFYLGHKGRVGLFELLMITDVLRSLIVQSSSVDILRQQALQDGMQLMVADGLEKVKQGIISLHELLCVIGFL